MSWLAWTVAAGGLGAGFITAMRWAYYLGIRDTEERWSEAAVRADEDRKRERAEHSEALAYYMDRDKRLRARIAELEAHITEDYK